MFERWFYFFVMFSNMLITHSCGVSMTSSEVTNFACLQNLVGEFEILKPFNGDNYVTKNWVCSKYWQCGWGYLPDTNLSFPKGHKERPVFEWNAGICFSSPFVLFFYKERREGIMVVLVSLQTDREFQWGLCNKWASVWQTFTSKAHFHRCEMTFHIMLCLQFIPDGRCGHLLCKTRQTLHIFQLVTAHCYRFLDKFFN